MRFKTMEDLIASASGLTCEGIRLEKISKGEYERFINAFFDGGEKVEFF